MNTDLAWGIEEMGGKIFVGPLRPDSTKLYDVAFAVDIFGHTKQSKKDHRAECRMIVQAVNEYNQRRRMK